MSMTSLLEASIATFVVLIPKKGGVEDSKDFMPISLVGSLYKWLAKVLTNILKKVLPKLISKALKCLCGGKTNLGCGACGERTR